MIVETLMRELGAAIGLPTLRLDEQGCARLRIDNRLDVNFEFDSSIETLQLYSVLGPLPPEDREALYETLLKGNLFCADTLGATLAIDTQRHEILLCRSLRVRDTDATQFLPVVENFVTATEHWMERLAHPDDAGKADAEMPSRPLDERGMFIQP